MRAWPSEEGDEGDDLRPVTRATVVNTDALAASRRDRRGTAARLVRISRSSTRW